MNQTQEELETLTKVLKMRVMYDESLVGERASIKFFAWIVFPFMCGFWVFDDLLNPVFDFALSLSFSFSSHN